jgi:hypothetical protein
MKDLEKILLDSLISDTGILVSIDSGIPKTTIRIHDSRTMILYGIGKMRQQGFTLSISIDKNSNKGKRIKTELAKLIEGFGEFDDSRSIRHLHDYGTDINKLMNDLTNILNKVKGKFKFTVSETDGITN